VALGRLVGCLNATFSDRAGRDRMADEIRNGESKVRVVRLLGRRDDAGAWQIRHFLKIQTLHDLERDGLPEGTVYQQVLPENGISAHG
jgi:hypothetical protein